MLVSREIGHDVKAAVFRKDAAEEVAVKVERVGAVIVGHHHARCRAQVARKLGQTVFVEIDQLPRAIGQHRLDVRRADRAGSAYHEQPPPGDTLPQGGVGVRDVVGKEAARPPRDILAYKFLKIYHIYRYAIGKGNQKIRNTYIRIYLALLSAYSYL